MLVEVIFIAKLELFLQDPLVSMASVISIFLLTSGVGSYLYKRVALRVGMVGFPLLVAGVVCFSVAVFNTVIPALMEAPMAARLAIAFAVVAPSGVLLGMFYPYAVSRLVAHDRERAVPITYGVSTLASVLGATYAMTFMIIWGFDRLLFQAAALYLLLALLVVLYGRLAKENLLA